MAAHNDLGKWGEELAVRYLIDNGYVIMHRNWQCGHRDLDIVATKDGVVAFVEVRTRRNAVFMEPEESVGYKKALSVSIAANAYVKSYRLDATLRFDIIAITGTPATGYTINHIPDAFYPPTQWSPSTRCRHRY